MIARLFLRRAPKRAGGGYVIPWTQDDAYFRPPKFGDPMIDHAYDSSYNFGMFPLQTGTDLRGPPLIERILQTQPDEAIRAPYASRQYADFALWLWGGAAFFIVMSIMLRCSELKRMTECEKGIKKCDVRVHQAFHRSTHLWDGDAWLPYTKVRRSDYLPSSTYPSPHFILVSASHQSSYVWLCYLLPVVMPLGQRRGIVRGPTAQPRRLSAFSHSLQEWQSAHREREADLDTWLSRQQAFFRFIGVPEKAAYGYMMTPLERPSQATA